MTTHPLPCLTLPSTPTIPNTPSCKNTPEELPFLYEDHASFAAFPTFPLVLPFKGTSHDVVPFPSPTLFSFPPGACEARGSIDQMDGWIGETGVWAWLPLDSKRGGRE